MPTVVGSAQSPAYGKQYDLSKPIAHEARFRMGAYAKHTINNQHSSKANFKSPSKPLNQSKSAAQFPQKGHNNPVSYYSVEDSNDSGPIDCAVKEAHVHQYSDGTVVNECYCERGNRAIQG